VLGKQRDPDADGVVKFANIWLNGLTSVANEVNGTFNGNAQSIAGNVTNATGGNNNDRLLGDGGSNTLRGGNGNDWLDGRGGNDTLTGGNGTDTFAFDAGQDGANIITDYSGGETIRLTGFGLTASQAANAFFQSGSNVVFNRSGVQITIQNANVSTVRANVETDTAVQYSPGLAPEADSFSFDEFSGSVAMSMVAPPAPTGEEAGTVASEPLVETSTLDNLDHLDLRDLLDAPDPDSGLYY